MGKTEASEDEQRSIERYKIIYVWKVLSGLVENCGLNWYIHEYKGRLVKITHPKGASNRALELWRQTLPVNGGSLFNSLPQYIRDISDTSVDSFKLKLDLYLETIPDCPMSSNLYPAPINPISGKNSNCIMDWIQFMGRNKDTYHGDTLYRVNGY